MNSTERQIVAWLRDMCKRAPDSGHGMQGWLAAKMWEKVANAVERGDHRRHAALTSETIIQAGPAQPEPTA